MNVLICCSTLIILLVSYCAIINGQSTTTNEITPTLPIALNYTKCPVPPFLPEFEIYVPHPNCSYHYHCQHGFPISVRCPDDQHWNAVIGLCDSPENANCTEGAAPIQIPPMTSTTTVTIKTTLTTTPMPLSCPAIDPQNYTAFLPHPNCSLYYICSNGYPILSSCAPGLHWSSIYNWCDYSQYANCTEGPTQSPPIVTIATPAETPIWSPPPIHTYCPEIDPEEYTVHLPHPNCSVYYKCEYGQAYEIPCPPGLHWSIAYDRCDFPEIANCTYGAVSTQAPPNGIDLTTVISQTTITPEIIITTPSKTIVHGSCKNYNSLTHVRHLPHPDCSKYYRCLHGLPFEEKCPTGLHWNHKKTTCDFIESANCIPNKVPLQA